MIEIFMPKAGMDMKEGRLIRWLKNVGDPVELDEPIMEIETDKITMEAESPGTGILLAKLIEDNTTVPVLQTIGWIGQPGEKIPEEAAPDSAAPSGESAPKPEAPGTGAGAAAQTQAEAVKETPVFEKPADGYTPATPLAKRLARENGVSLADIAAGGPVRAEDVLAYVSRTAASSPVPAAGSISREPVRIPLTGIRKAIARNMYQSLQSMAQTSDSVEVDVTELVALKKSLALCSAQLGVKISINDLLSFAAVKMIRTHPLANASYAENELLQYPYVNLCTAVATDYGLVSPVVRDADRMNLFELSRAIHAVIDKARNQKLSPEDLTDGTFTLTNMGIFPVDNFNPILPSPQSCILGFGRCVEKPAIYNGEICIRTRMVLSVTYDHRVFDGGEVGRIMKTMKEYLEDPELLLSE
ncbi:MAG: 2-oxo acid dehydrogenase subunit E2 [Lachnospiraceae bacterium]|nr:2-oxo acid dehydrogenase subunit E2 [Lachnospiraceae bacterium]